MRERWHEPRAISATVFKNVFLKEFPDLNIIIGDNGLGDYRQEYGKSSNKKLPSVEIWNTNDELPF